jgi:aspartyl-tRNA(Asn)/glutamyl-tRNA(Gln) amidotransferase subunit B
MNSFRAVERALTYEAERQFDHWRAGGHKLGDVPKQTRGWDDAAGVTRPQRSKEESSDYRYFPDPDLLPVTMTPEQVERVRSALEELPASLRHRLEQDYGLTPYDADVIVNQGRSFAQHYEIVAQQSQDSKAAANWVTQEVLRALKEQQADVTDFRVSAVELAAMIERINSGKLPGPRAREVFQLMVDRGIGADAAIAELGIEQMDESALIALCESLIRDNPKIADDVRSGNTKAVGALIGKARKENPNVDPNHVRETCLRLIGAIS